MSPFTPHSAEVQVNAATINREKTVREQLESMQKSLSNILENIDRAEKTIRESGMQAATLREDIEQMSYHDSLKKVNTSKKIDINAIVTRVVENHLNALTQAVDEGHLELNDLPKGHAASKKDIKEVHQRYNQAESEYREAVINDMVPLLKEYLQSAKESLDESVGEGELTDVSVKVGDIPHRSKEQANRYGTPCSRKLAETLREFYVPWVTHNNDKHLKLVDTSGKYQKLVEDINPLWVLQESFAEAMLQLGVKGSLEVITPDRSTYARMDGEDKILVASMEVGVKKKVDEYRIKNKDLADLTTTIEQQNATLDECRKELAATKAKIAQLQGQLGSDISR